MWPFTHTLYMYIPHTLSSAGQLPHMVHSGDMAVQAHNIIWINVNMKQYLKDILSSSIYEYLWVRKLSNTWIISYGHEVGLPGLVYSK